MEINQYKLKIYLLVLYLRLHFSKISVYQSCIVLLITYLYKYKFSFNLISTFNLKFKLDLNLNLKVHQIVDMYDLGVRACSFNRYEIHIFIDVNFSLILIYHE